MLALAVMPDGDVIAAGSFTMAGDVSANRIARWDGTSWHALGAGLGGLAWDMAILPDGDLVAGGLFTTAGGIPANRIARWDGKQWHAMGGGFDVIVRLLAVFDAGDGPRLYAGGDFTTADGEEVNGIAMWDGNAWSALDGSVDGIVRALQVFDDGDGANLYVAGEFDRAGALPIVNDMARWDGSRWWAFGGGLYGDIAAMAVLEGDDAPELYAVAQHVVDGVSGMAVTQWDGLWWRRVSPLLSGGVAYALAASGAGEHAVLFIGGGFDGDGEMKFNSVVQWQACPVQGLTHHVPGQYGTIQAAIDAASDGDIVLVGPGTYHEAIDYLGKTIIVESEQGAEATIIDATGLETRVVTVTSGEGVGTTLRGFTITGGAVEGAHGGGIRVAQAALTIDSCSITGNSVGGVYAAGGGLAGMGDSDILVIASAFTDNIATHGGGAIVYQNLNARFFDCVFRHNTARFGGGINLNSLSNAMLVRCTVEENMVVRMHGSTDCNGGGMRAFGGSGRITLEECDIMHNTSECAGAGIYGGGENFTMRNCYIAGNSSKWSGGGARLYYSTIINCTFEDNTAGSFGGGAYLWGGFLLDCMIEGNAAHMGGGAYLIATPVVNNCIFARNDATDGAGGIATQYSWIESTHFCENVPEHIYGSYEDLGGNTFAEHCDGIPGDLNGDGVVDVSDLLILLAAWGSCPTGGTSVPPCPADLNGDGVVDISDLLILLSNWG